MPTFRWPVLLCIVTDGQSDHAPSGRRTDDAGRTDRQARVNSGEHPAAGPRRSDDRRTWNERLRWTGQPGDGQPEVGQKYDDRRHVAHAWSDGSRLDKVDSKCYSDR